MANVNPSTTTNPYGQMGLPFMIMNFGPGGGMPTAGPNLAGLIAAMNHGSNFATPHNNPGVEMPPAQQVPNLMNNPGLFQMMMMNAKNKTAGGMSDPGSGFTDNQLYGDAYTPEGAASVGNFTDSGPAWDFGYNGFGAAAPGIASGAGDAASSAGDWSSMFADMF